MTTGAKADSAQQHHSFGLCNKTTTEWLSQHVGVAQAPPPTCIDVLLALLTAFTHQK